MGTLTYDKIVMQSVLDNCKAAFILIIISFIFLSIEIIYYCHTKANDGISLVDIVIGRGKFKNRYSTKQQMLFGIVGIMVLLAHIFWTIVPAYQDISKNQYISAHAEYSYSGEETRKTAFSNGTVYVKVNGEEMFLELPANWKSLDLPIGTYQGTLCYSKESKILLSFSPITPVD